MIPRRRHHRRVLNQLQRLIVAKELFAGETMKEVSIKWRISNSQAFSIFQEYIGWIMYWKKTCEVTSMCTWPGCACAMDKLAGTVQGELELTQATPVPPTQK